MSEFAQPQSRNEAILQNILGAENELLPPFSRIERILISILNGTEYTDQPGSRIEALLLAIKEAEESGWARIGEAIVGVAKIGKDLGFGSYEPQSRNEEILICKLNGVAYTKQPQSRIEELLKEWTEEE